MIVLAAVAFYLVGAARAGKVQFSLPEVVLPIVSELPFLELSTDPTATPAPAATPTSLENGALLYSQGCASCHGQNGVGVEGLGTALANSPQVAVLTESEMFAIIRDGRAADAPNNRTGIAMPPSAGQENLTDEQIVDIILYIQSLQ